MYLSSSKLRQTAPFYSCVRYSMALADVVPGLPCQQLNMTGSLLLRQREAVPELCHVSIRKAKDTCQGATCIQNQKEQNRTLAGKQTLGFVCETDSNRRSAVIGTLTSLNDWVNPARSISTVYLGTVWDVRQDGRSQIG